MAKETGGNQSKKKEVQKKKLNSGSNCCLTVTTITIALLAVLSYKVYQVFYYVPELPYIDLDEWWGANDTRELQDTSVRPFRIVFTDAMEADLRQRIELYRQLPKNKTFENAGWTYGVNSEEFARYIDHWVFKYDFKQRAKFFNQYNHFKTNVQGLDIHFVHVKPKVDKNIKVLPLLLLHGWPGSFREFYETIPLLTTPRPGRDFVFEVIVPSLPGYGYSEPAVRRGLSTAKVGVIMRNLMKRLGFSQFYVQGGDMGHLVGSSMATIFSKEVVGYHTNMPFILNKAFLHTWVLGGICSCFERLVEKDYPERLYPLQDKLEFYLEESGYMHIHYTKPDTWGIALQESPAGLAGYILEKFVTATTRNGKFSEDGNIGVFSKDALIDNVMVYWATGSMTTAMRLYAERMTNLKLETAVNLIPTEVPTWGLRLKYEIFFAPEWILKWKYTNLLGTTTLEEGGHFAALEKPSIFADDVFEAVGKFQEFHRKRKMA